jgi:hypothetical protein
MSVRMFLLINQSRLHSIQYNTEDLQDKSSEVSSALIPIPSTPTKLKQCVCEEYQALLCFGSHAKLYVLSASHINRYHHLHYRTFIVREIEIPPPPPLVAPIKCVDSCVHSRQPSRGQIRVWRQHTTKRLKSWVNFISSWRFNITRS